MPNHDPRPYAPAEGRGPRRLERPPRSGVDLAGSHRILLAAALILEAAASPLAAQKPAGLARQALARTDLRWVSRADEGLRVHFLAGSYAARHQDSLVARVRTSEHADLELLGLASYPRTIDVFFVDSRTQMDTLVGAPVTGFAQMDSAAVFLVTNPGWRAFERHEIMHVLAVAAWGRPAPPAAWIQEGLAQFADGRCGGSTVDEVVAGFVREGGEIPFDTVFARFRELDDLTAYLEAASLVGFVERGWGMSTIERIWREGSGRLPEIVGRSVERLQEEWRSSLPPDRQVPTPARLAEIRSKGCG